MSRERKFVDRIQDRLWSLRVQRYSKTYCRPYKKLNDSSSISSAMAWPSVCAALVDGHMNSVNFRRLRAVIEVVETLGPSEGRHHANLIRMSKFGHCMDSGLFDSVASWGNPMKWPAFLLGTAQNYAPSTLRYLSHAIWLKENEYLEPEGRILEIGVGYGGLAAMNWIVSGCSTMLVDLPVVERAAMTMLDENSLTSAAMNSGDDDGSYFDCLVSNYAFTELTSDLQKRYIESYAVRSRHGMILSNANSFANKIKGMDNDSIVAFLRHNGINAVTSESSPILSPVDHLHGSILISW